MVKSLPPICNIIKPKSLSRATAVSENYRAGNLKKIQTINTFKDLSFFFKGERWFCRMISSKEEWTVCITSYFPTVVQRRQISKETFSLRACPKTRNRRMHEAGRSTHSTIKAHIRRLVLLLFRPFLLIFFESREHAKISIRDPNLE